MVKNSNLWPIDGLCQKLLFDQSLCIKTLLFNFFLLFSHKNFHYGPISQKAQTGWVLLKFNIIITKCG
jgi:hypothetical protein